ncbi:UNVERIFIED_CONTAM: hypothetical protein Sradi_4302800 [Sesamum radiatum]|uniref:Integrase catalytic domain-containing protein n=1 Tax=Sesamum radiatum TaxID=300843 RepID=A0AAW2NLK5_SESRA
MSVKDTSQDQVWLLHVDGSFTTQGSDAGIVITTPQGKDLEFAIKFGFKASNNEAEYEALVIGMRMAHEGIDIVGHFPLAAGQRKFLLVAIDYFTKWVEAEPLARITEGEVMKFIWKNIVCGFGIPQEIISDNDRQFQGQRIQEWCRKEIRKSRRKLGRRINQCPVGLQDNPQRVYWRKSLLTGIRN